MRLEELAASSAFVYLDQDPDYDWIVLTLSGDYATVYVVDLMASMANRGTLWKAINGINPIMHGLGRDGLYGTDAAALHDWCRELVRDFARGTGPWADEEEES
jgi:hypothetical protein